MTETITPRKITAPEVALMRQLVAWRKSNGFEITAWRGCWRVSVVGRSITWSPETGEIGYSPSAGATYRWIACETFGQGVDVLVAFGYLPARFSTAYRAGWHAAEVWFDGDEAGGGAEFERLFHDPANISFPAVGE